MKGQFDYEEKVWGAHEVRLSPRYLGALRLEYCLKDLQGVQGKVLEVGCGAGGMARGLKAYRPDLDVFGCDISRRAIRATRGNAGRVSFSVADAYCLPFCDESFSAVVMFDILEHLQTPAHAIGEAQRVLRPGGVLHLFAPCEGSLHTLHGLLARAGWRAKERYGGHIQRFEVGELKRRLASSGLSVERVMWSCHLINQVADVGYFTLLGLRRRNTRRSVEGYLEDAKPSLLRSAVAAAKVVLAATTYYESKALARVGGAGIHLTSRKPDGGNQTALGRRT